jgi:hypothetical protein
MEKLPPKAKDGTNRGRPEGSANKMAREAREQAKLTGKLPHEIMLDIARGEPQYEKRVDPETGEVTQRLVNVPLDMRLDAAKAAAPYYAPKISTVEVLAGASEHELDRLIAVLAAEAGIGVGTGSESEVEETEGGEGVGVTRLPPESGRGTDAPTIRRRPVTGTRPNT